MSNRMKDFFVGFGIGLGICGGIATILFAILLL